MLTSAEKIIFALALLVSLYFTWRGVARIVANIASGQGKPDWTVVLRKAGDALFKFFTFQPVFQMRPTVSILHGLIGWGFIAFLLINLNDFLYAYFKWRWVDNTGLFGDFYRLLADIANIAILIGILALAFRRFALRPPTLGSRQTTLYLPSARTGISRDSAIVAGFIFLHNSARLMGESFFVAEHGHDAWQPFISTVAGLWAGMSPEAMLTGERVAFWLSMGAIAAFLPYFPYSKHIHLFFAPINFALKPERKSIGELGYIDMDDEKIEQFGAAKVADLGYEQIVDAYACIMCFRCQEVCPAYNTGKILSPAALEINKRYNFNLGGGTDKPMLDLIPEEAVWACTSCGACVDVCPVGNEPMRDILDIRRNLAMMEASVPKQLESAFRGMERNANPWNVSPADRMKWAEGLSVPTIDENPEPELLWWVGCAPATDARAQKTARAFAKILNAAELNFAVLGRNEQCTGDSARRAGREDIFFGLASGNVEMLNEVAPKRIVTTCPHCLHTLKNEYPAFGGEYEVIHHTQLINELIGAGKLKLEIAIGDTSRFDVETSSSQPRVSTVTYHDPCYLSRHNGITEEPRNILASVGAITIEMPRNGAKAFCCGAGGAQMWKEEESGQERVNNARYAEAKTTETSTIAVGCPFCLTMMSDAAKSDEAMQVLDVAEIIAMRLIEKQE
jgi:Fe-S oxidoreductase